MNLSEGFECNKPECNWFENCKEFGCGTALKKVIMKVCGECREYPCSGGGPGPWVIECPGFISHSSASIARKNNE